MNILEIIILTIYALLGIWFILDVTQIEQTFTLVDSNLKDKFYSGRVLIKYVTEYPTFSQDIPCNLTKEFFDIGINDTLLFNIIEFTKAGPFNIYYINLTSNTTIYLVKNLENPAIEFRRLCIYRKDLIMVGVQV